MTRALFLSILLHILAVTLVVTVFKLNSLYPRQSIKKISIGSIIIKKPTIEKKNKRPLQEIEQEQKSKPNIKKEPKPKVTKKPIRKKLITKKITDKKAIKKVYKSTKKVLRKQHKKVKKSHNRVKRKIHPKRAKYTSKNNINKRKITQHQREVSKSPHTTILQKAYTTPSPDIKAQIYRAINEVQVYPRLAKKMNLQGRVYTCFNVASNKSVSNITTSGAHPLLLKGARQTINRAKQNFPNIPNPMHLCVTITYILE